MKNAIILHGRPDRDEYYDPNVPSSSNYLWMPWLQKQLLIKDITAQTPEVPHSYKPRWDTWVKEVERFEIGPETMLVGHSCGGGFWVRYLSEHPKLHVGKVVLVAPWINPEDDPASDTADFFHFKIDPGLVKRTKGLMIFNSDNDMKTIHNTVEILRKKLKGHDYREFPNYGHFCLEDGMSMEFPELLAELLS